MGNTKLFKSKSVPVSTNKSKPSISSDKKHIAKTIPIIPPPPYLQSNCNTHSHDIDSSETSEESFSETPPAHASTIDISIERTPEISDQSAIYLLLTQQRDEAILQNEKMENAAHEKEIAFTLKLSAFKKQLKQYKYTNNKLMKENISLKDEISKLK